MRWRPAVGWFGAAIALYALSAARGPMWADSSKLTLYALAGYLPSLNPGDHPGWTLLALVWLRAFAWAGAIPALHMLSAVGGAAAVGLMWMWVAGASADRTRAHTTAAVMLVALPHWWAAALTETYTLGTALVLAAALASRRDGTLAAFAAGVLAGLGAAVHLFTVFLSGPLLAALPPRRWVAIVLGGLAGSSPIWLALLRVIPDPLTGHLAGSAGSWRWVFTTFLDPGEATRGLLALVALLAYALGPLGLLGLARGARSRVHPAPWLAAGAAVALLILLSTYAPSRLHLMVGFPLVALLLLAPPRLPRSARAAHVLLQVLVYVAVPFALAEMGRSDLGARRLPGRSNAWYFLCPVKSFDEAAGAYARTLLTAAPPDAVVLADFNPGAVLRLLQASEGRRPDVTVVPTAVDEALGSPDPAASLAARIDAAARTGRAVVLADSWEPYYRTAELRTHGFDFEPCGPGLLVVRKPVGGAGGEAAR